MCQYAKLSAFLCRWKMGTRGAACDLSLSRKCAIDERHDLSSLLYFSVSAKRSLFDLERME